LRLGFHAWDYFSFDLDVTYDKSTMSGNMMNVHGSDGEDEKCKIWLGDNRIQNISFVSLHESCDVAYSL
jgi:hypothetical protein